MTENNTIKENSTDFKFILFQGKEKLVERIFNADIFNPNIRYSVDIRQEIPSITQRLQKVLSRRNLNYVDMGYNFLKEYESLSGFYNVNPNKLKQPKHTEYSHGVRTIKGVECKFGLYINDNPIVERKIYVDNYNPASRFSTELVDTVNEIVKEIHDSLKVLDVDYMWGDYILFNTYRLYNNQIKDLTKNKRDELIKNSNNSSLVKKYREELRVESL